MADLREQLNAIVDRLDHLDGHDVDESEELEWAVKQLKTLAAQPAPAGEVALPEPWQCETAMCPNLYTADKLRAYGDARAAAAASRPATAVPEGWRDDVSLAAQMLTWGREEGLTESKQRDVDAHQAKLFAMLSAAPQPAAVKQDLTTAQGARLPLVRDGVHGTVQVDKLMPGDVFAGWVELKPEAKAGADDEKRSCAFAYCAYRKEGGCKGGCFALSQPKPAEGGAVGEMIADSRPGYLAPIPWIENPSALPVGTKLYAEPPAAATRAELDELLAQLREPAQVHSMMLRGVVATPSWRTIVDVRGEVPNGEDRQLSRIAELQEDLDALKTGTATRAEEVEALHPSTLKWLAEEISFEHGQGEGSELGLTGDQRRLIHLERLQRFARRLAGKGAPHA